MQWGNKGNGTEIACGKKVTAVGHSGKKRDILIEVTKITAKRLVKL